MSNPGRTLLVVALVVVFCFATVSATETDGERKGAAQASTTTTIVKSETAQDNPTSPTLPTGTPAAPEAGEQINWWVIGGGGGTGSSTGYTLSGTLGQTAADFGTSPSYQLLSGYWQVFGSAGCCVDRVGDANGIGGDEPTIGDISVMIDAKFITGTCDGILDCFTEADINQSGGPGADCDDITIGDISTLIDYLFITGPTLGLPDCL